MNAGNKKRVAWKNFSLCRTPRQHNMLLVSRKERSKVSVSEAFSSKYKVSAGPCWLKRFLLLAQT
jgi:hypothetical protein